MKGGGTEEAGQQPKEHTHPPDLSGHASSISGHACPPPHPLQVKHKVTKLSKPGPNGEQYAWWQCTVKVGTGSRELGQGWATMLFMPLTTKCSPALTTPRHHLTFKPSRAHAIPAGRA